jgi:hypothetical protein
MSSILYLKITECRHAYIHVFVSISRDSFVIVLGYGLYSRCSIPDRGKRYSFSYRVQTGTGAHPLYPMGTVSSFLEGKEDGA